MKKEMFSRFGKVNSGITPDAFSPKVAVTGRGRREGAKEKKGAVFAGVLISVQAHHNKPTLDLKLQENLTGATFTCPSAPLSH